jgi:hypothetical protein
MTMDSFYDEVHAISEATDEMSETAKLVVLVRVALERGAGEMGMIPAIHLLSKLVTIALGIMARLDLTPDVVV